MFCTVYMPGAYRGQKRAPDTPRSRVIDGCELPCDCWDSNQGPLGRVSRVLNHLAISPAPLVYFFVHSRKFLFAHYMSRKHES